MGCHSSSFIFKAQIIVDLHGYKRNKSKLHLRSTDTVNDVLVRIRKSLQAKYNQQFNLSILHNGQLYSRRSLLKISDLYEGNSKIIHIVGKQKKQEVVSPLLPEKETEQTNLSIDFSSDDTVSTIKKGIEHKLNNSQFLITTSNSEIATNDRTISEQHLKQGDSIYVVEFSETQQQLWRIGRKGLVLQGICNNKLCQSFRDQVDIFKGLGSFDMVAETEIKENACCRCNNNINQLTSIGIVDSQVDYWGKDDQGNFYEGIFKADSFKRFPISKNWKQLAFKVSSNTI